MAGCLEKRDTDSNTLENIPESLFQCRNLSCTPFFLKIFERFVFARLNNETKLSDSQFDGRKNCGVDHMIIDMWESILTDLDKGATASSLVNPDFEKAFNTRLNHDACINALRSHGATALSTEIVHSFLSGRTVTAQVGESLSKPRKINGGSPQGSILGKLLLTMTTDKLTTVDYTY